MTHSSLYTANNKVTLNKIALCIVLTNVGAELNDILNFRSIEKGQRVRKSSIISAIDKCLYFTVTIHLITIKLTRPSCDHQEGYLSVRATWV